MHQHPRSPAVPPSAPKVPSRPTTGRDELREQDPIPASPSVDIKTVPARGLGIDSGSEHAEQTRDTAPGKEAMAKLNQIISVCALVCGDHQPWLTPFCTLQNYHTKAALIILHSRVDLPPSFTKGSDTPRVNRWVSHFVIVVDLHTSNTDACFGMIVQCRAR